MLSDIARQTLSRWLQAEKELLGFSNDELAKHISSRSGHSITRDTIGRFIKKQTKSLGSTKPAFVGYLGFTNAQFEAWLEGQDTEDIGRSNRQILRDAIEVAEEDDLLSAIELIAIRLRSTRRLDDSTNNHQRSASMERFAELMQQIVATYGFDEFRQLIPSLQNTDDPQETQQRIARFAQIVAGATIPGDMEILAISYAIRQLTRDPQYTEDYLRELINPNSMPCNSHVV